MSVSMYACMYACIHIHTYIYIYTCYIYIMLIYSYVYIYTKIRTCIYRVYVRRQASVTSLNTSPRDLTSSCNVSNVPVRMSASLEAGILQCFQVPSRRPAPQAVMRNTWSDIASPANRCERVDWGLLRVLQKLKVDTNLPTTVGPTREIQSFSPGCQHGNKFSFSLVLFDEAYQRYPPMLLASFSD